MLMTLSINLKVQIGIVYTILKNLVNYLNKIYKNIHLTLKIQIYNKFNF